MRRQTAGQHRNEAQRSRVRRQIIRNKTYCTPHRTALHRSSSNSSTTPSSNSATTTNDISNSNSSSSSSSSSRFAVLSHTWYSTSVTGAVSLEYRSNVQHQRTLAHKLVQQPLNPLGTAVAFSGQTTQFPSSLFVPKTGLQS